jgi:acyl dehydratase
MNHHPLHLDKEYCKTQKYGKILVVGTFIFSLVVGFTVSDISGKAIANLDYEKVDHNRPVFIGDTLRAETLIIDKRESKSKKDRGIVYVETKAYNQKNEYYDIKSGTIICENYGYRRWVIYRCFFINQKYYFYFLNSIFIECLY